MPVHWESRDRKIEKRKNGMRVSGRSVFVVRDAQQKRDEEIIEEFDKKHDKKTARQWRKSEWR